MQPAIRRATVACLILAGSFIAAPRAGATADQPSYTIIGASVTRLSRGPIYEQLGDTVTWLVEDGRSFMHPGNVTGINAWDEITTHLDALDDGDWLIVETAHGGVPVNINRGYYRELVEALPDDVCLAVVLPSTAYDTPTEATDAWNQAMHRMILDEIPGQPCHATIDWYSIVQSEAVDPVGQPVLYDGRHPTEFGGQRYAAAIAEAVGA